MSAILEPIITLEKQLEEAKQKAVDTLLRKRAEIDDQLKQLGYGKRGRPAK